MLRQRNKPAGLMGSCNRHAHRAVVPQRSGKALRRPQRGLAGGCAAVNVANIWICGAIRRALEMMSGFALDLRLVMRSRQTTATWPLLFQRSLEIRQHWDRHHRWSVQSFTECVDFIAERTPAKKGE